MMGVMVDGSKGEVLLGSNRHQDTTTPHHDVAQGLGEEGGDQAGTKMGRPMKAWALTPLGGQTGDAMRPFNQRIEQR